MLCPYMGFATSRNGWLSVADNRDLMPFLEQATHIMSVQYLIIGYRHHMQRVN